MAAECRMLDAAAKRVIRDPGSKAWHEGSVDTGSLSEKSVCDYKRRTRTALRMPSTIMRLLEI